MRSVNKCPEARSDSLLTEQVGDELVIFDGDTNEAHALKPLAAVVFTACDGSTPVAELAAIASAKLGQLVEAEHVEAALTELEDCGLLVDSTPDGMSRRRLLQVGGAAAAGVLVSSALVPALAAASVTCQISGLSQFGILIYDGTNYFFVTAGLAGAGNGSTVSGACSTDLGGNSGGNGENGVCWHNATSLPGPDGTYHTLASCSSYSESISFTVSGSDLVYTLPSGTQLVGWWAHNGSVCAGPFSPSTSTTVRGCTYTTNPCSAF
jgi:hypothetical protein